MGCNRELEYIEPQPGVWYYIYEDAFAPKDSIDWLDFATAYGPFLSLEVAQQHFYDEQPHNGGSTIIENADFTMFENYEMLIAEAEIP